jgi:two-component system, NtrC family, sensor histidine kinase HydH
MFRIRASEVQAQIPKTAAIILAMLVLAFALSFTAVLQVNREYRLLGDWQARPESVTPAAIGSLRRDIGSRIVVRSTASAVLLLCTLTMVWLQQRQLALLRVLYQVKLLSLEILASMDQGVITTDHRNVITGINTAAVQILGVESECIGRPLPGISSGSAPLVELAGQVAERNAAVWDQDFAIDRSGRARRIRADAHVLKDSAGKAVGCIILLRDVSDRVMMEERVQLMERFVSLGTLAAGLHHEIKNPLTALSIHVQLLEKRLGGPIPTKPVDELLGVVKSEILRLNGVLDSFRDFASLHRLTLRPTNVVDLLTDIVRLIGPQAIQQHVEVTLHRPETALAWVLLDGDKFKQTVLNLVINALEAMPDGGSLLLDASAREGELLVEVADTGPGIAPEIQQDLFKPYSSTKCRGTGMGLALSEKVVSQHGGRIEYRTGPHGTSFFIAIPLDPASRTEGKS